MHTAAVTVTILTAMLAATAANAADVPVAARKLVITDRLAVSGRAKVVFVALDSAVTKGSGTDPAGIAVTFDVSYAGTSAAGAFVLPAGAHDGSAGWKANKSTVAKYVNKLAPGGGPTDAKVGIVKPGTLLKIVGKSLGDTPIDLLEAGTPLAGGVDTVVTVVNGPDTVRHCTNFPQAACSYKTIAAGTGAKLTCRNGSGAACPSTPSTTSTTTPPSSTTSTVEPSSTTTSSSVTTTTSSTTSTSTSVTTSTTTSSTTTTTASTSSSTSTSTSTSTTSTSSTTTTLCSNQLFTFTVNSTTGGAFSSAKWPGGTATQQQSPGCTVTINRPNDNIDLVCTLAQPFSVQSFTGFSNCFGIGGEDGDGCQPVSCPPLGIGSCCQTRPSCSAALNGTGSAQYFVQCLQ